MRISLDRIDIAIIAGVIVFLVFLVVIAFPYGDSQSNTPNKMKLRNDTIYACPKGDWSGYTKDMKMTTGDSGYRYFYCPIDGAYIGWQSTRDPLPIGQEG